MDVNELGGAKSTISVDNIRICTSAIDNATAVGDHGDALVLLGAALSPLDCTPAV